MLAVSKQFNSYIHRHTTKTEGWFISLWNGETLSKSKTVNKLWFYSVNLISQWGWIIHIPMQQHRWISKQGVKIEVTEAYKHNDFTSQNRQKNIIGGSWKNTDTTMKTQVWPADLEEPFPLKKPRDEHALCAHASPSHSFSVFSKLGKMLPPLPCIPYACFINGVWPLIVLH